METSARIMLASAMALFIFAFLAVADSDLAIRSSAAEDGDHTWNPQNFAGLYYDMDENLGTEESTFSLTGENELSGEEPYGIRYRTVAQKKSFASQGWGCCRIVGFLGDECFAGYIQDESLPQGEQILYAKSSDPDSMVKGQLQRVLIDDHYEQTMTGDRPLHLKEGYVLAIKSVDPNGMEFNLELSKDGAVVDSMTMAQSMDGANESDKTYYYRKNVGSQKDLAIIAVHFKDASRVSDADLAVDGIWQISESPIDVKVGSAFGLMKVAGLSTASGALTMANKDNQVNLTRNMDKLLAGELHIKLADESVMDRDHPPRYYLYRQINQSGTYEIRGSVAAGDFEWNPQNFAGFYYDLDLDLGQERLNVVLDGKELSGSLPYGLNYQTSAQKKSFQFEDWGFCSVLGFMGKLYLAGYAGASDPESINKFQDGRRINTLAKGQLEEVLLDDDQDQVITTDRPLQLKDGYQLQLKDIDAQGDKSYVELHKNGRSLKSSIIPQPDRSAQQESTTAKDETYVYSIKEGDKKNEIIKIHFVSLFRGDELNAATVDSIWQISEKGTPKVLMDRHDIETIDILRSDLQLAEGYNLSLRSVDMKGEKAYLELSKNGEVLDSRVISVRKGEERTGKYYYYQNSNINLPKIIEVDFKSTFKGPDSEFAIINGLWQASEEAPSKAIFSSQKKQIITSLEPLKLKNGYELALKAIDANGDKAIVELYRNGEKVETRIVEPPSSAEGDESFNYSAHDSAGNQETIAIHFKNVFLSPELALAIVDNMRQGSEERPEPLISSHEKRLIALKEAIPLKEGYQLVLQAIDRKGRKAYLELKRNGSLIDFAIVRASGANEGLNVYSYSPEGAGSPEIIKINFKSAFLGQAYGLASTERVWQARESQSHNVLRNSQEEIIISATRPLRLDEGYRLELGAVDVEGDQAYVELYKDERLVDRAVISSREANETDRNFVYSSSVGKIDGLLVLAVHLKNFFRTADDNIATVDAVWQISEKPLILKEGDRIGKMKVQRIDPAALSIQLANEDNEITLGRNEKIPILDDLNIRVADSDTFRYYIYKPVVVEQEVDQKDGAV